MDSDVDHVLEQTVLAHARQILPKILASFKTLIIFIFVVFAILSRSTNNCLSRRLRLKLEPTICRFQRELFRLVPSSDLDVTMRDTVW